MEIKAEQHVGMLEICLIPDDKKSSFIDEIKRSLCETLVSKLFELQENLFINYKDPFSGDEIFSMSLHFYTADEIREIIDKTTASKRYITGDLQDNRIRLGSN
jgi:hypothetical protein